MACNTEVTLRARRVHTLESERRYRPLPRSVVPGVFTSVLAKHTKSFNLIDTPSVGVDRIQRNFEPLQRQVELWRKTQITDDTARLIFYSAFIDGKLEAPKTHAASFHFPVTTKSQQAIHGCDWIYCRDQSLPPRFVRLVCQEQHARKLRVLVAGCKPMGEAFSEKRERRCRDP